EEENGQGLYYEGLFKKSGKNDTSNFFVSLLFRCSRINCIRCAPQSYAASNFPVLYILLFERILKGVEIMLQVYFYTKTHCPLCEDAKALLLLLQHDYPFNLEERDIYTNDAWLEAYQISIPVVEMNGKQLDATEISYGTLERALKENM